MLKLSFRVRENVIKIVVKEIQNPIAVRAISLKKILVY